MIYEMSNKKQKQKCLLVYLTCEDDVEEGEAGFNWGRYSRGGG